MQERKIKQTPMRRLAENPNVLVPEHTHPLHYFADVPKVKSIWRTIRRGNASRTGRLYPTRPFNNSKRTKGRKLQVELERINKGFDMEKYLQRARKTDTANAKERKH